MKTSSLIILLVACVAFYIVKKYCYKLTVKPKNSLAEILEQRYSGYSFDPKKQVTQEQIKLLIRAAQLAPSSYNEQPWNFIICDKTLHPEAYNKAFNTLAEGNQKWAQNAQILVIIAASINSLKNNEPNLWAQFDTGAATFSMAIQAAALGLMTHQMAGFDKEKITKLFTVPKDIIPLSIMAIGYEDIDIAKYKSRERKPIEKNFFFGDWHNN